MEKKLTAGKIILIIVLISLILLLICGILFLGAIAIFIGGYALGSIMLLWTGTSIIVYLLLFGLILGGIKVVSKIKEKVGIIFGMILFFIIGIAGSILGVFIGLEEGIIYSISTIIFGFFFVYRGYDLSKELKGGKYNYIELKTKKGDNKIEL